MLPLVDRARASSRRPPTRAHRRLRRLAGQPGPAAARDRRRRPVDHRPRPGPRRAPLRRRAHRGRHRHRRRRGGGPHGRGHRPGRLHQHLDRRGHRHPLHDRGQHAGPARLRHVHPERHPGGGRPAGGRGRPVQGPAPGRPGPRRRACATWSAWSAGQIADPDFAAKARSGHATDIRTCLSCNQECVGRMGLNRWLGCIENPRAGRESAIVPRSPRAGARVVVVGGGPGRAAGRGHRRRARPPGGPLRAPRPPRRPGPRGRHASRAGPSSSTSPAT